jgi:glucose-6-phosphate dehydrogenase assembly protein OpcA
MTDRVWRPSSPEMIEHDLAALWRDVSRDAPVARAMMSNLIVLRTPLASWPARRAGVSIDAVAAKHPSRVLIVDHESVASGVRRPTDVRVGVVTFGPPQARYGVEQIAVRSACMDESLPSLVRRLVRGGLPISVWCDEDLSEVPLVTSLLEMGRQLVYDSRRWRDVARGVAALQAWRHLDLADVNWRRIASMRRALIFAASSTQQDDWTPDRIRIAYRREDRTQAWLLAGWLAARLGWPTGARPRVDADAEKDLSLSVTIGTEGDAVRIDCDAHRVTVTHPGRPPSLIRVPKEGEAEAVAAELHSLSHDVSLQDILSALHRYFSA